MKETLRERLNQLAGQLDGKTAELVEVRARLERCIAEADAFRRECDNVRSRVDGMQRDVAHYAQEADGYRRAAVVLAMINAVRMSPVKFKGDLNLTIGVANENPGELQSYLDEILRDAYGKSVDVITAAEKEVSEIKSKRKAEANDEKSGALLADLLLQAIDARFGGSHPTSEPVDDPGY